jgi:alkyldihydroxyacetonephosphate synthase
VHFPDPAGGIEAVRLIAQSELQPANCRLISPLESALTGLGDGRAANLLLGFESSDHDVDAALDRAIEICLGLGGKALGTPSGTGVERTGSDRWRTWFFQAPYLRDRLALRGLIVETLETASAWIRFDELHLAVVGAIESAIEHETGRRGVVTWRLTHAYPDGVAVYYTVIAVGLPGREAEQWSAIKVAASDAIAAAGGATTHHHAVGRTHVPWFERERGATYLEALRAAKLTLDPAGIMNPGVLLREESALGSQR